MTMGTTKSQIFRIIKIKLLYLVSFWIKSSMCKFCNWCYCCRVDWIQIRSWMDHESLRSIVSDRKSVCININTIFDCISTIYIVKFLENKIVMSNNEIYCIIHSIYICYRMWK